LAKLPRNHELPFLLGTLLVRCHETRQRYTADSCGEKPAALCEKITLTPMMKHS
jgi:hypothetical protein